MKVGIIGLGLIGQEWAKHQVTDGNLVAAWNRSPKPEFPFFTKDLSELAKKSEILQICIADPDAVGSVLEGLLPALSAGHLVIQSSTIDPESAEKFSELVRAKSARYLEAPFTGSLPAAQRRETIFYIGGERAAIDEGSPYLSSLSKKIIEIGSERQAATVKLIMNLQISSAMQALAEALSIARQQGVKDDIFFEAFRINASFSGVAALKEPKLKANDFSPQFATKHMAKDLRLLSVFNKDIEAPILERLQTVFAKAIQEGLAEEDFASLIKLLK